MLPFYRHCIYLEWKEKRNRELNIKERRLKEQYVRFYSGNFLSTSIVKESHDKEKLGAAKIRWETCIHKAWNNFSTVLSYSRFKLILRWRRSNSSFLWIRIKHRFLLLCSPKFPSAFKSRPCRKKFPPMSRVVWQYELTRFLSGWHSQTIVYSAFFVSIIFFALWVWNLHGFLSLLLHTFQT